MDTLITIIISGMAISYIVELLSQIFKSTNIIKIFTTLPLALLACWLLGLTGFTLIVGAIAAAFFSLASLLLLNRTGSIQTISRR
jgi:hypothetical protein